MGRVLFSVVLGVVSFLSFLPSARPCQASPLHVTSMLTGTDGDLPACIVTTNASGVYEDGSFEDHPLSVIISNECDETFELEAIDDHCVSCTQLLTVPAGDSEVLWVETPYDESGSYVSAYQWALGESQGLGALEVEAAYAEGGCPGPFGCSAYPVGQAPPFSSASMLLLWLLAGLILRKRPVRQA